MKNITLEMSFKPFMETDDAFITKVAKKVWTQWYMLCKKAEQLSILLFVGDGCEILDYKGNLNDSFPWGSFIGVANNPPSIGIPYRDNPVQITYGIVKKIVATFKAEGGKIFPNKKIRVGAMFDIGPEFAISDFKYKRHRELLVEDEGVFGRFVDCTANMHADNYPYAGFPEGVPEGLPFATLLGRQSEIYLKDMGFDYLWLSNGTGFSAQPWKTEGKIFSNGKFYADRIEKKRNDVIGFWKNFRKECPDIRIETRGTNFTVGIDYSTDGVCAYDLYKMNLNFMPPPNSPMAALNGNYGLELIGHLSRIAELPDEDFMFRYYIHDPWFKNSPWYDRYEGQPHDIYLPMSLSRINKNGETRAADHFDILSIDNSYGTMPDSCVVEPMPHILKSFKDAADAPAPFVWLYPVKEYTRVTDEKRLNSMFFTDWMFTDACNNAFPMSSVVSTDIFEHVDKSVFKDSVIVSVIPYKNTPWEKSIIEYVEHGGKVILVGDLSAASEELLQLLKIGFKDNVGKEEFELPVSVLSDTAYRDNYSCKLVVKEMVNTTLLNTINLEENDGTCITTEDGFLVAKGKNNVYWYRGVMTGNYIPGDALIGFPSEEERISGGALMRNAARYFGWDISLNKYNPSALSPIISLNKNNNGLCFSLCLPDTTVETAFRTPYGAPLLMGYETLYKNGKTHYNFPRAEHRECRVFIEKCDESVISCREMFPGELGPKERCRRRISITGLKNATVRYFPEKYAIGKCWALMSEPDDRYTADFSHNVELIRDGDSYVAENVTGIMVLYMPDYDGWNKDRYVKEASIFE